MLSPEELLNTFAKDCFTPYFDKIEDPRKEYRIKYPMIEVLFLVVSSILSGYESNRGIAQFGELKLDWLRKYFPYKHGIPTHESIGNIIGLIEKKVFEKCFTTWISSHFGLETELIHIDGKRISNSVDRHLQDKKHEAGGKRAEYFLNAYASEDNLVIAQINITESGDEKVGAKQLIEELNLRGKTITGDGNFCTKEIMKLITNKGGDYLMTLKRNQPTLFNICTNLFEAAPKKLINYETVENGHGRHEKRKYEGLEIEKFDIPKFKEYSKLKQFVRVERTRTVLRKEKTSNDIHYYITSSDKGIEYLAKLIRSHWSVENNLHWVLDVEFKEDDSRKRSGNQASNFSLIRKLVLNLVNDKRGKKTIKAWRMGCSLSDKIRENTLGFS